MNLIPICLNELPGPIAPSATHKHGNCDLDCGILVPDLARYCELERTHLKGGVLKLGQKAQCANLNFRVRRRLVGLLQFVEERSIAVACGDAESGLRQGGIDGRGIGNVLSLISRA